MSQPTPPAPGRRARSIALVNGVIVVTGYGYLSQQTLDDLEAHARREHGGSIDVCKASDGSVHVTSGPVDRQALMELISHDLN